MTSWRLTHQWLVRRASRRIFYAQPAWLSAWLRLHFMPSSFLSCLFTKKCIRTDLPTTSVAFPAHLGCSLILFFGHLSVPGHQLQLSRQTAQEHFSSTSCSPPASCPVRHNLISQIRHKLALLSRTPTQSSSSRVVSVVSLYVSHLFVSVSSFTYRRRRGRMSLESYLVELGRCSVCSKTVRKLLCCRFEGFLLDVSLEVILGVEEAWLE